MLESNESSSALATQHLWRFYYDRCFPFSLLCQWLTCSEECTDLEKREISFAIPRGSNAYYLRWQSFSDVSSFRSRVLHFDPLPHKIDIGAYYSAPVLKNNGSLVPNIFPVEKELVFDIDMNDYDDIRQCCQGKELCSQCWYKTPWGLNLKPQFLICTRLFLAAAADVIGTSLREDFGFCHIVWVFSGRRGLHGWVCDPAARILPSEARSSIISYLTLVTGTGNQSKKVKLFGNVPHPFARRSYEICLPYFEKLLSQQKFFDRQSPILSLVNDYMSNCKPDIKENYFHKKAVVWNGTSLGIWELVLECCLPQDKVTPIELLLTFCYPRLDANVSKDITHLLKMPFCIHEATGKVCVPISPEMLPIFDPASVPTLTMLQKEYAKEGSLEKTSLQPYIDYFTKHVVTPVLKQKKVTATQFPCVEGEEFMENLLLDNINYQSNNIHKITNHTTAINDISKSSCDW